MFFSIQLDNQKSKEELAIAYIKQTEKSAVETKYFRVEESKIILLDTKKKRQSIYSRKYRYKKQKKQLQ